MDDYMRIQLSKGTKIYLPIIAAGYKSSQSGEINFSANLEVVAPNGEVTVLKKCCSAIRGDPRTPGLVVLNPVIDITFNPKDPPGTYTVRAMVTDGSRSAAASENFRVQTGAAAEKEAVQQSETKPPASASATNKRSRANEDARECLKLSTNAEIIKCAEKFR